MDEATLAASLVNTKTLPPGLGSIKELAAEAWAYHKLEPYPKYHFKDWKVEDRGPLPRCLPIAKGIVRKSARWLFGKPLGITVPGNTALEETLKKAWDGNRMCSRMVAVAERAALEGGIVLKFSYDETLSPAIRIQALSLVSQVRLYYHPHDCERLLMARVQYPFFDPARGETFWYREEWTEALEVHYHPVEADRLKGGDPDAWEGWVIDSQATQPNPFGLIPLHHVKNVETDDLWGGGDCWDLYRVIDRVHLTFHLMDRSNQYDSQLNPIFFDADLEQEDIDRPMQPGQAVLANTREDESNHAAKVAFPPTGNNLRPAMMEYAKELRKQVNDAIGTVHVDQADFTNKGNLTVAVLEQLYQPLIEATDEKRKTFGEDGLVPFFAAMARGLQNVGVPLGVTDDEESFTAELKWPDYFRRSEDEKAAKTERLREQETAGYVPRDMAVEEVSAMEERDAQAVKDGLAKETPIPTAGAVMAQDVKDNAAAIATQKRTGGKNAE